MNTYGTPSSINIRICFRHMKENNKKSGSSWSSDFHLDFKGIPPNMGREVVVGRGGYQVTGSSSVPVSGLRLSLKGIIPHVDIKWTKAL